MAQTVHQFQKGSSTVDAILPSGWKDLVGFKTFSLVITKPDKTVITKSLTDANIYNETCIRFTLSSTDLDTEGICDYQLVNTTTPTTRKGKILQFTVVKSLN